MTGGSRTAPDNDPRAQHLILYSWDEVAAPVLRRIWHVLLYQAFPNLLNKSAVQNEDAQRPAVKKIIACLCSVCEHDAILSQACLTKLLRLGKIVAQNYPRLWLVAVPFDNLIPGYVHADSMAR
jgi:hypothetical protein